MKNVTNKKSNPSAFHFVGMPDSVNPAWQNPLLEVLLYALVSFLIVAGSVMSLSSGYHLRLDAEMVFGCVLVLSLCLSALYRSPVGGWVFPAGLLIVGWIGLRNWEELWAEFAVFWNRALELLEPYLIPLFTLDVQAPLEESGTPLVLLLLFFLCLWVGFFSARLPRLFPVFLLTFALMELVFWIGLAPNLIFMTLALSGYGLILALSQTAGSGRFHRTGYRRKKSEEQPVKVRSRPLPRVLGPAMLTVLALFLCSVLAAQTYLTASKYERPKALDRIRNTALTTDWSSIFYFPDFARGNLIAAGQQTFDHKTDIRVTAPYQSSTLYLRGFTGARYKNGVWKPLPDSAYRNEPFPSLEKGGTTYERESAETSATYRQFYETIGFFLSEESKTAKFVTVDPVRTGRKYAYLPYSAQPVDNLRYDYDRFASLGIGPRYSAGFYDYDFARDSYNYFDGGISLSIGSSRFYFTQSSPTGTSDVYVFGSSTFGETSGEFSEADDLNEAQQRTFTTPTPVENPYELSYRDFVMDQYLEIPEGFERMQEEFDEQLINSLFQEEYGSTMHGIYTITEALRSFLRERTEYSLSPGLAPAGMDPLNHFLYESHKGYCMHFASVSTLLFRQLGVPARYVEGYVVAAKDFNAGTATTGADGNAALLMPLKDSNAHAWTEIYLDGYGWIPIETTPGYAFQLNELPTVEQEDRERREAQRLAASAAAASSSASSSETSSSSSSSGGSSSATPSSSSGETGGKGGLFPLILLLLFILSFVVSLPFLSRRTVLYFRKRSTSTDNANTNVLNLYAFLVVLLNSEKFPKSEYACYHPDRLAEAYDFLTPEQFELGMETVLRARFSGQTVTREEQKQLVLLVRRLQTRIYASKKRPGQLWMKYVRALI